MRLLQAHEAVGISALRHVHPGPVHLPLHRVQHKFQTTLVRRVHELERHLNVSAFMTPEVSALSTINFRELAGGAGAVGHEMIEFVEAVTLKNGKLVSIWRWCGRGCPCCYDFEVPEIEPAMPPRRCDPGNTPGGESKEQTARLREANAHSRLAGRWRGSGRWGRMVVRLVHHT